MLQTPTQGEDNDNFIAENPFRDFGMTRHEKSPDVPGFVFLSMH